MTIPYQHRVTNAARPRREQAGWNAPQPEISVLAESLVTTAASWWERWRPWYARLDGPLVGSASKKTLAERSGLIVTVLARALREHAPAGSSWTVTPKTTETGYLHRVVFERRDGNGEPVRHGVAVNLDGTRIVIGESAAGRIPLAARDAGLRALRVLAEESAQFFMRRIEADA